MSKDLTDLQLLTELEPVVEQNINRHMRMRKDWNPHDFIPWSDGKNYLRARRPGLGSRAVEAVRGRPGRDDGEPPDRGQPAVLSPRDRDELRHGRPVGSGSTAGPPRRTGTASRCVTTSSSPAPSTPSSSSSCASSR